MGIRQSESLVKSEFTTDEDDHPTGGFTEMKTPAPARQEGYADGEQYAIFIRWQNGIIQDGQQNGAFVEDVIEAARQRIMFFNSRPESRCRENSVAITKLEEALQWLDWRTRERVNQGVENTYEAHTS
jgi:hypothetical protein